jgi:hypothetical protein
MAPIGIAHNAAEIIMPILAGVVCAVLDPWISCIRVVPIAAKHYDLGITRPARCRKCGQITPASLEQQQIHRVGLLYVLFDAGVHGWSYRLANQNSQ